MQEPQGYPRFSNQLKSLPFLTPTSEFVPCSSPQVRTGYCSIQLPHTSHESKEPIHCPCAQFKSAYSEYCPQMEAVKPIGGRARLAEEGD